MSIPVSPRRLSWVGVVLLVAALAVLAALLVTRSATSPAGAEREERPGASGATAGAAGTAGTPRPREAALTPVPVEPVRTLAAVPIDEPADFGTGVRLLVTAVEAVDGEARGPGEIAGPAVRVDVELVNDSGEPISLEHVVVGLEHGRDRVPASPLSGPPSHALRGDLEQGTATRGTYVYAVPAGGHDDLRIVASYTGEAPTVVLVGAVS